MIQPKCTICGLDLTSNEGRDTEGKVVEPQVSYFMHDPRSLHRDILVTAHKDCFDKVKLVYPNFDQPVQDYDTWKIPRLKDGVISLKTPKDFLKEKII